MKVVFISAASQLFFFFIYYLRPLSTPYLATNRKEFLGRGIFTLLRKRSVFR